MYIDKVLIKNISALFSIKVAMYLIPLVTLPYLVQTLEPQGFGVLGFSLAIIQYFILLVNYGFDLSATQKIAQSNGNKSEISKIFWNVICCRGILCFVAFLFLILLCELNTQLSEIRMVLIYCYTSVIACVFFPQWLFQGKEEMGLSSIINIIVRVFSVPFIFYCVKSKDDVDIAALIPGVFSVFSSLLCLYIVKKRNWIQWCKPTMASICHQFKDGWHVFISMSGVSLYTTSVTVVLGFVSGTTSVGIYVAANKLMVAAQGISTPISGALYPRISTLMVSKKKEGFKLIRKLMHLQLLLGLCIFLCTFLLAEPVILFLYGSEYIESVMVLKILAALPLLISLSNTFGVQTLLTLGYKKVFTKILLGAGVFNVCILFPLAFYYSYLGASISVVITELIVTCLMVLVIFKKKIPLFNTNNNTRIL